MTNALSLFTATESEETRGATADYWEDFRTMLASGMHVLAYGPPGTGKTHSALYYGTDGRASFRHQCKPSDTAEDVLGRVGIVNGSTVFQAGAGALAVETGARFIFDEVDRASEDDYALLYSLGDRKPFLLADGSVITPHPRLQVILTTNEKPEDLFPIGSGIADRFPFLFIPEPSAEALETLPALFRESARRAVRSGITGFRAWQHFERMLGAYGFAPEDLLAGLDENGASENGNGIRLPEAEARERMYSRLSASVFGPNGSEVLRAFRVAACRDETNSEARRGASERVTARERIDAYVRDAYESGRSDGLAEGLSEAGEEYEGHRHDTDTCEECSAMYDSGHDCGAECAMESHYCEHDHDSDNDGTCRECDRVFQAGYEAGEESGHDHDSDNDGTCSDCDYVYRAGEESGRSEAIDALETIVSVLYGAGDGSALAALVAEECGA